MEYDDTPVLLGMTRDEVEALLGPPDRTHVLNLGTTALTSWIYHTTPDPMVVWFDGADRVRLNSANCRAATLAVH